MYRIRLCTGFAREHNLSCKHEHVDTSRRPIRGADVASELDIRWGKWRTSMRVGAILLTIYAVACSGTASAQDPSAFYNENCAACHTIGGGAGVGPDLKDLSSRRDRAWLIRFLQNPEAVINSGDAYARGLVAKSGGLVMPEVKGLDQSKAEALLDYIDAQSKPANDAGSTKKAVAERPFTAGDVERGKEIVLGRRALAGGGASCVSCHTLHDLSGLGGGRLGPDLTRSYERMGGTNGMKSWLSSPPTPTMQAAYRTHAFTSDEILALVAYFESSSKQETAHSAPSHLRPWLLRPWLLRPWLLSLLIGIGGSLVGLVLLDEFWRKRFRAVRRPLVARKKG